MKEKNKKVVNAILIIIMIVLAISIVSSLTIIIVKNTKFDKKNKPHGFDPNRTIDAVSSTASGNENNELKRTRRFEPDAF